jgi:tetratricopeptide (TPR) repeat protein
MPAKAPLLLLLDDAHLKGRGHRAAEQEVAEVIDASPESADLTDFQRFELRVAVKVLEKLEGAGFSSERLPFLKVIAFGKLGQIDEAIRIATREDARAGTWQSASMLAGIHRRQGDFRQAVAWYEKAAARDATDCSAFLDAGDLLIELKDWPAAIAAYEAALALQPDEPWARPSAAYCRLRQTGDKRWLEELKRMAAEPEDACGVSGSLAVVFGQSPPGYLQQRARSLIEGYRAESAATGVD